MEEKSTLDELVRKYLAVRDKRDQLADEQKKALKPYDDVLRKLENVFLEVLNEDGLQNIATESGTIYKGVRTSVTVEDWEATLGHIVETKQWDLLEKRVSKSLVKDMAENGEIVPGVSIRSEQYTRVNRRSK